MSVLGNVIQGKEGDAVGGGVDHLYTAVREASLINSHLGKEVKD